ncbi:MAG TPA: 50S ribosomal protein L29 [Candidatus Dormibacteraeota bacterium]|jgi:large subunit ribosomal protein L29|nr:50S ribosomal protein L29 [Candidatus Dormibacteraeota bacterium]
MSKHEQELDKLREMSDDELHTHLLAQRRKLFEIRLQQATGQVENTTQIRHIRREIARAMTVQMEAARTAPGQEA